jgi:hypothetical protein
MTSTSSNLHWVDPRGCEQCDPGVLEIVRAKRRESGSGDRRTPYVGPPLLRVQQLVIGIGEEVRTSAEARHMEPEFGDD